MSRAFVGLVALIFLPCVAAAQARLPPPPAGPVQTITIRDGQITTGTSSAVGVVPPQAPPRDQAQPKTGTSRIRGRVIAADTGAPLRRAAVRVNSPELREGRSAVTDADGRFEVVDLPAGRYSVSASKTSYVGLSFGQTRPTDAQKQVDVAEKQVVDRIDFRLLRGGVITGRVLDEYGEPVAGAQVQPMQMRFMNGQRRPMPMGPGAPTPDTGEFRLWGLAPGDYYISVSLLRMGPFMMNETSNDRSGYGTSYYPGTPNVAEAQAISVAAGQVASGADIILMPTRTANVSGTAIDSKGQPVRAGMVMAMSRTPGAMMMNAGGQIRPDGTFTVSGLAPGDYTLRANSFGPRAGNEPSETMTATVTVNGGDITGVVLMPVTAVTVTGRVVFDPAGAAIDPSVVQISANSRSPDMMNIGLVNTGPTLLREDHTFELKAAPGQMLVRAFIGGPGIRADQIPGGPWQLKSVRYDSKDITDTGLELSSGRDISGVEIVMTNRAQVVTGMVTTARGEIAKDAVVLLFSQDKEQWGAGFGRHLAQSRPDKDGKYSVRSLAAGDYYAVALEKLDQQRFPGDPDYFELLSRDAERFTLVEEETRTVDLKLTVQQ